MWLVLGLYPAFNARSVNLTEPRSLYGLGDAFGLAEVLRFRFFRGELVGDSMVQAM